MGDTLALEAKTRAQGLTEARAELQCCARALGRTDSWLLILGPDHSASGGTMGEQTLVGRRKLKGLCMSCSSPNLLLYIQAWWTSVTALSAPPHRVVITPREATLEPLQFSPIL